MSENKKGKGSRMIRFLKWPVSIAGLVLMIAWTGGVFHAKTAAGKLEVEVGKPLPENAGTYTVKVEPVAAKIDVVGTDHAPHTLAEKQQPYLKAPSGLPLVQHALVSLLEHVHDGLLTLEQVVEKTAHAPARLFDIKERGYLREGYWADLVLVDLERPLDVARQQIWSKCGWSPFEGLTLRSSVDTTIVSGQIAYRDGRVRPACRGQALTFKR